MNVSLLEAVIYFAFAIYSRKKITESNNRLTRENEELQKQVQIMTAQLEYAHQRNGDLCNYLLSYIK